VKRRLDRSGLGDFCLELHSYKASPKSVVSSLQARYEIGVGRVPTRAEPPDVSWVNCREEITRYVRALHAERPDGATAYGLIWEALRGQSKFADLGSALRDIKIPASLIDNPQAIAAATDELGAYAGVASAFALAFGHPAKSLWATVEFSNFHGYEVPQFLQALEAARTSAADMLQTLTRYAEIGVTGPDSLMAAADLAGKLPELPQLDLASIASLDLDDLEKALDLQADVLRAEEELEALSDLRYEDPERLAVVAVQARSVVSTELLDHTPAEAYAFASKEIAALEQIVEVTEAVTPALKVLGLGIGIPASHLPAATSAAYILGSAPEHVRRWIVELPDASLETVSGAIVSWRQLRDGEARWTAELHSYRADARPEPNDLLIAAATLRKRGLRKLFASIRGSLGAARSVAAEIGMSADPDKLRALAEHVADVRRFEGDETFSSLFGSAWAGLITPVDSVRAGLELRDLVVRTIQHLPGNQEVAQQVMAMTPDRIAEVSQYGEACKRVLRLPTEAQERFEEQPTDRLILAAQKRISDLKAFLAIDATRWAEGINAPIRRIEYADRVIKRMKRTKELLASHATAAHVMAFGRSYDGINLTSRAIDWVRVVRRANLRADVAVALLSDRARDTRDKFVQAASDWNAIRVANDAAFANLAEFGAQNICRLETSKLIQLIGELLLRSDELADFVPLRRARKQLDAQGLSSLQSTCDRLLVDQAALPAIFLAVIADYKATAARRSEGLRSANGAALEARRKIFCERDVAKMQRDRRTIRAKLLEQVPQVGSNNGPRKSWTDMRLLTHEFGKQRRLTPVRQLLSRAGRAIQTLTPCFMMSPLSLAKFIPTRSLSFDLLIIDEASQMRPEASLGGLLRVRQIVVVGDAKQLPPTDFFARGEGQLDDGVDDSEDIDAESILEACETIFGERRRLKWHYRSRCESLIAFSNQRFYDGTLVTFPMARPGSFSVELVRVDGTYRARCNPAEASRVAEEAVAFMRHFGNAQEDVLPTLGIVAVNLEQRDFIQEELRRLSADDEFVEMYRDKAEAKGEPLFVKNLENVQGDERDHIFISMTYGKKHGEASLSQNFGPINKKQGHRRLNVLFTRARMRIALFASFGSADVRPSETSSEGVQALKAYLEYAETRGRAHAHAATGIPDSDFEVEVADRLRSRGYKVDMQVGVARKEERRRSFRIDLAVRHPDHPEHYLAGIECDGATYHSSKSARDRDRLREEVLRSLGWELVRIWSTDWFDDPVRETDRLVGKLQELRKRPTAAPTTYPQLHEGKTTTFADYDAADGLAPKPIPSEDVEPALDASTPFDKPQEVMPTLARRALLKGNEKLSPTQAVAALETFRDEVIAPAAENWEPERSILRQAMIETFVMQRISDPGMWFSHVPHFLRIGTNGAEKKHYLQDICGIIDRL
jgi:hypothetical protein